MKTLLAVLIIFLVWSSPDLRSTTANLLRIGANFIEPKEEDSSTPKEFTIKNPFYQRN